MNHLATTIGNGTGPHSIPYTTNLAVECSFGGVPLPSQRWYRDGTIISSEGGVELGSGERKGSTELVLQEPVSGVYQCHVGNQYGSVISTTAICVHSQSWGLHVLCVCVRVCVCVCGCMRACVCVCVRACEGEASF